MTAKPHDDDLPLKPRLHRSYYIMPIPHTKDFLLYREGRGVRLKPAGDPVLLQRLFGLLDGSHEIDVIVTMLADFDTSLVISALRGLHDMRLLEDATEDMSPANTVLAARDAQRILFSHLTPDSSSAVTALAEATVVIFGTGAISSSLSQMLTTSGVGHVRTPAINADTSPSAEQARPLGARSADFAPFSDAPFPPRRLPDLEPLVKDATMVVAALDYPDPDLMEALNSACLSQAVQLLPVVLAGWEGRLGPVCIPGQTACVCCADLRAKANLSHYQQYLLYEDAMRQRPGERPFGRFPHFPSVLAGLAATEVTKIITACYPPATYGRMVVVDLLMAHSETHDVLRIPRCPACGQVDRRAWPSTSPQAASIPHPGE
jgi:bacteriocin biosynthesis cyclodehydratase domain-containing protein